MQHLRTWICIIVVFLSGVVFLSMNKRKAYSFDEIINDENLTIHFMENYVDQISGLYNNWNVYNDIFIDNYDDLVDYSDYIYHVKINSLNQIEDAIFTKGTILHVLKDEASVYGINDEITFLQMNKITYNNRNNSFTMQMYSPCMLTEKEREYIIFLNRIEEYESVFRTSTICYSIVPVENEIHIMKYDDNNLDYINKNQISTFYRDYKYIDYLIVNLNKSWLNENMSNGDNLEMDTIITSFEKEKGRLNVYMDIIQNAFESIGRETQIRIVDF